MITFFPDFYPDELVYSLLSRYYSKSGYSAYIFAAEDLYKNKLIKPDIEFLNPLKKEVIDIITQNTSMESVIKDHTMFPYYGRFIKQERRLKAYETLLNMNGSVYNLLAIPTNKNNQKRYLRYCPYCVEEDRDKYGETYWHRIHQMIDVNICPIHSCKLINSSVIISSRASPMLKTAEEEVSLNSEKTLTGNILEMNLAKYIMRVFQSGLDIYNDICIGKFLHSQMYGTKYVSVRGRNRNMELIAKDFQEFYKDLDISFKESWQIQKLLNGYRTNTYEVCLFSMFLNIPPESLINLTLPDKLQEELFDEKVKELHKEGYNYQEISNMLNASYNIVKPIGENLYGKYKSKPKNKKIKYNFNKWDQIDKDTFPLVKKAIKELNGNEGIPPKRITVYAVEKLLNLPSKRIYYLPLCKEEILKHKETQDEFWTRKIIWGIKKIIRENFSLNLTRIENLTNIEKGNIIRCIPYIDDIEAQEKIKSLL